MKFYGYKKCSTCRNAEKALEEMGVGYEFIDITEQAPSVDELKKALQQNQLAIQKLFNVSGVEYRAQAWKDKVQNLSEAELLAALASNGRLVKRPFCVGENDSSVGFKSEDFKLKWSR